MWLLHFSAFWKSCVRALCIPSLSVPCICGANPFASLRSLTACKLRGWGKGSRFGRMQVFPAILNAAIYKLRKPWMSCLTFRRRVFTCNGVKNFTASSGTIKWTNADAAPVLFFLSSHSWISTPLCSFSYNIFPVGFWICFQTNKWGYAFFNFWMTLKLLYLVRSSSTVLWLRSWRWFLLG